jgi:hypothetical protein
VQIFVRRFIGNRVVQPTLISNRVRGSDGAVYLDRASPMGMRGARSHVVFRPVEVTRDVPPGAILVAAGNEFLRSASTTRHKPVARWLTGRVAAGGRQRWRLQPLPARSLLFRFP